MLHIGKVVLLLFAILILSQALDITNVIFFLNYNVYSYATWRHNFTRLISLSLFKNISEAEFFLQYSCTIVQIDTYQPIYEDYTQTLVSAKKSLPLSM